ncbi:MAG TPA: hypothetical protein HA254_00305 [Candidatus Diapherotrites archaeon]|uniref:Uncharacterized protein n=1 Tax=Candidatus Iainarchaeum sp. TaxID=3101447 RepID=A0A7J4IUH5_9ARCH|nr:hypothetical protein [Candidatus Diapherotrites archaeon]
MKASPVHPVLISDGKGQSSLEYLMTYSWALVIIVVAIAALVMLIDPSQIGESSCTGFSKFPIANFAITPGGINLKVANETSRTVSNVALAGSFNKGESATSQEYTGAQAIPANGQASVTIPSPQGPLTGAVTVDLNISYFDGDFIRTAKAVCKGAVS